MSRHPPSVCVIVAAFNASATIGRAIDSALAQPEVAEVIVVDDASKDDTATVARRCGSGTSRLRVLTLSTNGGPSRARNIAIEETRARRIALLDADDFFLPGRFAALLAVPEWDMIADNIAFVDEVDPSPDHAAIAAHRIVPRLLSATDFVEGSISRRDRYKGELGFLKPVFDRAFLDTHRLRYAETMRLSEDYDLYLRALIAGARFRLAEGCHYVAVERGGSLSSAHGERELVAVEAAMTTLLTTTGGDRRLTRALYRHRAQIARKRRHRQLLARRHEVGLVRAFGEQARNPTGLASVLIDVGRDKWGAAAASVPSLPRAPGTPRFLL